MYDGSPTLEVGFAIDTGGSFGELAQLQSLMDSAEAKIVADAASIERATGGMLNLGGAKASMTAFGATATKEARSAARELNRVEKAGEALSRQMERDAAAFGKSRDELRAMKVEAAAAAAEQQGLTELAQRLRAQEADLFAQKVAAARQARFETEAAAEAEQRAAVQAAAAVQAQASAAQRLARDKAQLAAVVRGSQAAQEADAAAAERLRMATDPLYAATSRLNAEIAESTRLYYAGATAPAEYARQQEVLAGRLREVEQQHSVVSRGIGAVGTNGKLAGHHMQNLAFQFQDLGMQMVAAANSSDPLKMGLMALMQQGTQIQGIMGQAGIGIRGVGAAFLAMSKSILLATVTNPLLLGTAVAIGAVVGAIKLLQSTANQGAEMKSYAASLGLTAKEIRNLDNVTVTFGDTTKAVFQVAGRAIWGAIGPAVTGAWDVMKEWISWIFTHVKSGANFIIGGFVGAYNAIKKTWSMFPAAMGDIFYSAVNASIEAINTLIRKTVDGLNSFISSANGVLGAFGLNLPTLSAPQIAKAKNEFAGAAAEVGKAGAAEVQKAMGVDYLGRVGGAIADQARKNARDRLRKQAEEQGYLDPEKDKAAKADKHAERLARENEAIEAKIRNLYALAEAYKISGAEALIAEARVKAESDAIKKRGDIELFVNRQVRLAIAERVTEAAKATAAVREQAAAQEQVNALVASGLVPAERAAELVKDQIADLPLLAALGAAQQRGLADEAARATAALADQRAERERLRAAEEQQRFNSDMASGANRLAELREELRLVGATDAARNVALATLKATQDAETRFTDPALRQRYVDQQVRIAEETERVAAATRDWNEALTFNADRWDLIAGNVQRAAQGMAEAFGSAGRAIGDMTAIFADYRAQEERARAVHAENMRNATTEAAKQREAAKYGLATSTAQVGLYGDMAAAAKGFFKEGSDGYKALQKAEQTFRAIQFALSVRAMAQDIAETAGSIANSAIRAGKYAVEAVAKAIASLPFPANLAAGAATAAALAAIGISIAGAFGGGNKPSEKPNEGTGTVLGDAEAKSESIKRSIDALKEVDTLTNTYAREMMTSLRSIDDRIGGVAAVLVRQGDINASAGVTEGFKNNMIGSIFGAIPLVGGLVNGLFGTKTTVVGSGLYGKDQSLGSVLAGGFDASTYSDVQRKKKFFGITTSTKYRTQYGAADAGLESQFTLILRSFNDAIVAAAGPLGQATSDIQNRLNSFVVSIGKIDLKGLTGAQIQEKLSAIFGAAADNMANAAFPGIGRFQKVGEGAFETLVRVASTVEAVTNTFDMLGSSARSLGIEAKMGLAGQFDSISDLTSAAEAYFDDFYTKEEQAAAKLAQLGRVFGSLGLTVPGTLAAYRELVDAQDLTTTAGQKVYATLLQLAPAFADLQASLAGAKSAADIMSERQDLERRLLELRGDTSALRALDLAKLDASNRVLQEQIWALQDAQEAARAADELRRAWASVGDSIMDEVRRIRGLNGAGGEGSFASLMGRFNAMTAAARGGDMEAARNLPQLSQALLTAAAESATSRQELNRVQAQTAASLEATYGIIGALGAAAAATSNASLLSAAGTNQAASGASNDNSSLSLRAAVDDLSDELGRMRSDLNASMTAVATNTGRIARKLDDVTAASGGDAITVVTEAA
jgi:hypothetical protein